MNPKIQILQSLYSDLMEQGCTCIRPVECRAPVRGVGNVTSEICFVGRNPGKTEDEQGLPFVGRGGKLLDNFIERCGLKRNNIFITNLVKCYTTGDRAPTQGEIRKCGRAWLDIELNIMRPSLIVGFGAAVADYFTARPLREVRHQMIPFAEDSLLAGSNFIACIHPGAVLHNENYRDEFWLDAEYVKNCLAVMKANGLLV